MRFASICMFIQYFMFISKFYAVQACIFSRIFLKLYTQKRHPLPRMPLVYRFVSGANGQPAAFHAVQSSSFCPLGSFFRAISRRRAADLSAQRSRYANPSAPLCPGVLGPLAALVGPEPGGGVIGPTRVELPARAPHHIDERGLWPGCRLRRGHCFSAPDGRRQGPSPYPWP